jgi:hypothetical protein
MNSLPNVKSERGIALIVVLLLMAVLSGLATGYALTGQVEVQMATNEVNFAGARAAAEAGLNRAIVEIVGDTTTNLLAGQDGLWSATPADASNDDNGRLDFMLGGAGPYALGTTGQFSYTVEIFDDDNPVLYEGGLESGQITTMEENANIYVDANKRVILRATGFGPNGTEVRISRVIEHNPTSEITGSTTTSVNPAILVNGDLELNGAITVSGTNETNNIYGSIHVNGDVEKTGSGGTVTGSVTASGTADLGTFTPGGEFGGGRPTVNVPDIHASDYIGLADYKLVVVAGVGQVQTLQSGAWAQCTTSACKNTGWAYSAGVWSLGKNPGVGTYYVEGDVDIGPTSGSSNNSVSVISTGSINVHGNAKLTPENDQSIQFVADGDIEIVNGADLDSPALVDGQIMVRGQFEAGGNMEFQGRVMVQDVDGVGNLVDDGANRLHGSVRFTYTGTIDPIEVVIPGTMTTTYFNNVSGWMEQ